MRPQTLGLIVASTVTGVFMAAVGLVALWQYLPDPVQQPQPQPPFAVQFFNPGVQIAPFEEGVDFPAQNQNINPIPANELPRVRGAVVPAEKLTLSGPHTHGNLAIFLIHGEDTLKDQKILTLQEGIEQGLAVVHETRVAQLRIDNRSNQTLFVQAGDIIKGGTQDRTLPFDMLISAHTNNVPIGALCVEQKRFFPRGNEISTSFSSSTEQLPGRNFRLAAYRNDQGQVWANVQGLQANLARNVGGSVQAQISDTSLQLSLEHRNVQNAVQNYFNELGQIIEGKDDAIGYAVVINGKIQSADVYASNALFVKLWPKLLKAGAVEALAEREPGAIADAPAAEVVQDFLKNAESGQAFQVQMGVRGNVLRHESAQQLTHITCDPARGNLVLHRSYLAK